MNQIKTIRIVAAVLAIAGWAGDAEAQLANASAATLGLGGNAVATARGFQAIASNPAGLGMAGTPGFSIAVAPLRVRSGMDPVTLGELADYGGRLVPAETKEAWLNLITTEGGQSGSGGARLSLFALNAGRIGVQVSTLVSASLNLSPGVAEAILFGNAGRTGEPTDVDITGSGANGYGITTAAFSLGMPLPTDEGEMSFGATVTASVGHGILIAQGSTGSLQSDPLRADIEFPMLLTTEDEVGNTGFGLGLNVGFSLRRDRLSFGASVDNVVNTFEWDVDKVSFREGTAVLEEGNNASNFDEQPSSAAPASLLAALEEQTFDPRVAVGASYDLTPRLRAMAEVRNRFGDGLDLGPKFHAGAGLEFRGVDAIYIRAGAAKITDGTQLGGGITLALGPVHLSAAAARRMGDLDDQTLGQFTLSFGGH